MEPIRKIDIEPRQDADVDTTSEILREIARDARSLKARYLRETIVPEGGE